MNVGILTFHRAYNCGAMLQAWALKRALEQMGHTVEFPACNHVGEGKRWKARRNPLRTGVEGWISSATALAKNALSFPVEDLARVRYRQFREKHFLERPFISDELPGAYDALVAGSDQVWNPARAGEWLPLFLGENWKADGRAVAYGASWGDALPEKAALDRVKAALERFGGVSVREAYARDDLERAGVEKGRVAVVADPTLLMERAEWEQLAAGTERPRGRYLFMYNVMLDSREAVRVARGVAKRMGLRAVVASVYQYTLWGAPRGLAWGMSPERLVLYTAGAECVVASSFHGTVMGLAFGKPTLSLLPKPDGGRSRSGELLRRAGERWRLVTSETPVDEMAALLGRGGPSEDALARLAVFGAASREWLAARLDELGGGGRP